MQYINLLPRQRAAPRDAISLRNVVLASLLAAGASVALGAMLAPQVSAVKQKAAALRKSITSLSAPVQGVQVAVDATLARQVAEARSRAQLASETAQYMRALEGPRSGAFSNYFEALSRQTTAGVWLTGLFADWATDRVTIEARAVSPELVPAYLKRLDQESLFKGRQFSSLAVRERELLRDGPAQAPHDEAGEPREGTMRIVEFKLESPVRAPVEIAATAQRSQ